MSPVDPATAKQRRANALPTHLNHGGREVLIKYHKAATGRSAHAPNSLAAFREVVAGGARVIEVDVRPTLGGGFALLHDERLESLTTGHGRVSDHAEEYVTALTHCGTGDRVASLSEVVAVLAQAEGQHKLQLDLKAPWPVERAVFGALLQTVAPLLDSPNLEVVVGCLADWNLRSLRRVAAEVLTREQAGALQLGLDFMYHLDAPGPERDGVPVRVNAYGYLDDHPLGWSRRMPVVDYLTDRLATLLELVPGASEYYLRAEFVMQAVADGFDPVAFVTENKPGAIVDVWTVDRRADGSTDELMRGLLALGPGQVTTNTALAWSEWAAG